MKKMTFLLLLITGFGYSQNRYSQTTTSSFTPLSFDEVMYVAKQKYSRYNENQKYLYALKDWIRDLSSQIDVPEFSNRLKTEYNDLVKIENQDLAIYSKYLRETEDNVKEIIEDYNYYLKNYNERNNQQNYESNEDLGFSHPLNVQGLQQAKDGDYVGSIRSYSKYLEIDKNNTDILYTRAIVKQRNKDYQGAINDCDKVIELNSNYPLELQGLPSVYNTKALCLISLERYHEALSFSDKALELDKSKAFIWYNRGVIYYRLGEYNETIQNITKAISIEDNPTFRTFRGEVYSKLGQTVKANADFKKAEQLKNK